MHMRSCMRAHATVQKLLCHKTIANLSWVLCEHRAGCHLPPALLPARRNQSPDAVRSRNPSKSTLAHDAVAAALSHKHHSIIRIGAGLIQFVYGSHSRLAADLTLDKVLFLPWFSRAFMKKSRSPEVAAPSSSHSQHWKRRGLPVSLVCFGPTWLMPSPVIRLGIRNPRKKGKNRKVLWKSTVWKNENPLFNWIRAREGVLRKIAKNWIQVYESKSSGHASLFYPLYCTK